MLGLAASHCSAGFASSFTEPVPPPARDAVVVLLQPCDDGLEVYMEFLRDHQLAVIGVSDPWAALIAAPKADVVVAGILLARSMDGVELIARLRRDERTTNSEWAKIGSDLAMSTLCASYASPVDKI